MPLHELRIVYPHDEESAGVGVALCDVDQEGLVEVQPPAVVTQVLAEQFFEIVRQFEEHVRTVRPSLGRNGRSVS